MRILDEAEIKAGMTDIRKNRAFTDMRGNIRRREDVLLLRKLTFGTFYVVGILIAIKIAVMLWNDPMLITNLEQHYRSEMGWNPMRSMRLEFHVMRDLFKMALVSLF